MAAAGCLCHVIPCHETVTCHVSLSLCHCGCNSVTACVFSLSMLPQLLSPRNWNCAGGRWWPVPGGDSGMGRSTCPGGCPLPQHARLHAHRVVKPILGPSLTHPSPSLCPSSLSRTLHPATLVKPLMYYIAMFTRGKVTDGKRIQECGEFFIICRTMFQANHWELEQTNGNFFFYIYIDISKQLKNSREGRCVTRMFWGPFLVDRMMGG